MKFINQQIYKARTSKKISLKEAAAKLHINRLHLSLIEKGYLHVSKKRQQSFIDFYKLEKDFFTKNTTYVQPINEKAPDNKKLFKQKKLIASKAIKWTSIGVGSLGLLGTAYGAVSINYQYINPRYNWTEDFATFYTRMKEVGEEKPSLILLDDCYEIETEKETVADGIVDSSIESYNKEVNSTAVNLGSNFEYTSTVVDPSHPHLVKNGKFTFYLFCYNKKAFSYCSYYSGSLFEGFNISAASAAIVDRQLQLRPFWYTEAGKDYKAEKGSIIYNEFNDLFNTFIYKSFLHIDSLLVNNKLGYTSAIDLMNDVQKISRGYVRSTRVGSLVIIIAGILLVCGLVFLILNILFSHQLKQKNNKSLNVNKKLATNYNQPMVFNPAIHYQSMHRNKWKNDIKFFPIIPETVVRVIGLLLILMASLLTAHSYFDFVNGEFSKTDFKALSSNFLTAGVMLLFFIVLDIRSKKENRQLTTTSLLFFCAGLVFYLFEAVIYSNMTSGGGLVDNLLKITSGFIPGNVFFNMALYILIFSFLFSVPDRYNGNQKKIKYRPLWSLIPTSILIFSLIYQAYIKSAWVPYWINLLFFSKGTILTLFAIIYLYSLFLFQRIIKKKYGSQSFDAITNSRRYCLAKNGLAATIVLLLFVLDICFKYLYPNNSLKLGQSTVMVLIIPLILLYRPHIGARNQIIDMGYSITYGITYTLGYAIVLISIAVNINLSELWFVLF